MSIRDLLNAEPDVRLWPAIKRDEISRTITSVSRISRARNLDIECAQIQHRDGVLEVFTRAWQNNQQIGFGPDGSVDLERFRIADPRIYVRDPAGSFERISQLADGSTYSRFYREDPREALIQVIENAIRVKQQKTLKSRNIERGKVGSTTDSFFSGAGDGWVEKFNSSNWDTTHDGTSGNFTSATGADFRVGCGITGSSNYVIRRGFIPFLTGPTIPSGNSITSATCSLYVAIKSSDDDDDGDNFYVLVGATTQADPTTLANADFDTCASVDSPTEVTNSRADYDTDLVLDAYFDYVLNASGLAIVAKGSGYTLIGCREGHDVLDNTIVGAPNTGNLVHFSASENTGTTEDPTLVVEHSSGKVRSLALLGVGA